MQEAPGISPRQLWLAQLALTVLVCAVFGAILGHGFSAYDDQVYILTNPQIVTPGESSFADLLLQPGIGYIVPVTGLTQAALWAIGGGEGWPFHLASLLLHAVVVGLVLRLGARLTGHLGIAIAAAAICAVHPIAAEPVAWATGLKDLLMATFGLAGTLAFLRHLDGIDADPEATGRHLRWAWACAVLAALAKPTGAFLTLGWGLFLVARWIDRRRQDPAFGLPLAADSAEGRVWRGLVLLLVCTGLLTLASAAMHNTINVAEDADLSGDWQVFQALGWHLELVVWPDDLFPRYPIERGAGFDDWHTSLGAVGFVVGLAASVWIVARHPRAALGWGLALGAYLPVSNLSPFPRMAADSYVYMPLIGGVLAAACLIETSARFTASAALQKAAAIAVVALVSVSAVRTYDQAGRWGSPVDLWYPATHEYGDWPFAWMQITEGLRFEGESEHAVRVWGQLFARGYPADYLHKLALTLVEAEAWAEAECVMIEDVNHGPTPDQALNNLAVLLVTQPDYAPRHLAYARRAALFAAARINAGEMSWPEEMLDALQRRLNAARSWPASPEGPWPRRNCDVLSVPREEGPPQ